MAKTKEKAPGKPSANPVAAWRDALGFSPADAADALGMSEAELARYEAAAEAPPKYIQLAMKAVALGLTLDGAADSSGEE